MHVSNFTTFTVKIEHNNLLQTLCTLVGTKFMIVYYSNFITFIIRMGKLFVAKNAYVDRNKSYNTMVSNFITFTAWKEMIFIANIVRNWMNKNNNCIVIS